MWWRTGFNGKPYTFTTDLNAEWFVEFDRAKRLPGSFKEECLRVANEIPGSDPVILLSGGKDSEVVARSFMEIGRKFRCVILQYSYDNDFEMEWAIKFCKEYNIPFEVKYINVDEYYTDQFLYDLHRLFDRTGEYANWIWMIDNIAGDLIGGNGIVIDHCFRGTNMFEAKSAGNDLKFGDYVYPSQMVDRTGTPNDWWFGVSEQVGDSWENWINVTGRKGTSKFFGFDAEIFLSQLLDPYFQDVINNRILDWPDKGEGGSYKNTFYRRHFPELKERPKYTGFEAVLNSQTRKEFLEKNKDKILQDENIIQYRWKINDLIGKLLPNDREC